MILLPLIISLHRLERYDYQTAECTINIYIKIQTYTIREINIRPILNQQAYDLRKSILRCYVYGGCTSLKYQHICYTHRVLVEFHSCIVVILADPERVRAYEVQLWPF